MNTSQVRKIVNEELAGFFAKVIQHFDARDARFEEKLEALDGKFDHMQGTLDGLVGRVSDDEVERTAIISHQQKQDGWIKQVADKAQTTLVPAG